MTVKTKTRQLIYVCIERLLRLLLLFAVTDTALALITLQSMSTTNSNTNHYVGYYLAHISESY